MSLVPMFYRDWWDDLWWHEHCNRPFRTSRLMDQHFGGGLFAEDLSRAMSSCHPQDLRRMGFGRFSRLSWDNMDLLSHELSRTGLSSEKLQINLDVQQFTPNEITVKTVDNTVIVEGKHEEKQDEHGFVSRHFVRRYVLPSDHDPKDVVSSLSSDGVLIITAPKKILPPPAPEAAAPANERTIPVTQTGENSK